MTSFPLPPDHGVVWWLPVPQGGTDWARLERCLNGEERERATRFRFDADRHAYIAAHALVRALLSACDGAVAPAAWRFTVTTHGRPEIAADLAGTPPLRANLSHTRRLVAAAVCRGHDVGIDTEDAARGTLTMDLATHFFAPAEVAQAQALPAAVRQDALYGFWTCKEAYIKAVGLGLSLPLDSFAFTLDPATLEPLSIGFAPGSGDDPGGWLFRRLLPLPDHPLVLALRHPRPQRVTISTATLTADALGDMLEGGTGLSTGAGPV